MLCIEGLEEFLLSCDGVWSWPGSLSSPSAHPVCLQGLTFLLFGGILLVEKSRSCSPLAVRLKLGSVQVSSFSLHLPNHSCNCHELCHFYHKSRGDIVTCMSPCSESSAVLWANVLCGMGGYDGGTPWPLMLPGQCLVRGQMSQAGEDLG